MKINDMRGKRVLYSKLMATIALCISLTLLVSTFVYYTYYTGVEKTQTFRTDLKNLTQTGQKVVNMAEVAQTLSFQLYRTSAISHLLFYNKPSIYEVTAAMSDLGNYLNSMPFIESIYVYNPTNDTVYISASQGQNGVFSKNELIDTDIIQMLNHYQDYKTFTPIPRTYSSGDPANGDISVYTYLCYDAINWDRSINSAVIVNISAAWINKELVGNTEDNGTTYILDDQDRFLSGSKLTLEKLSGQEHNWIEQKVKGNPAGYFTAPFKGQNSLVSYTEQDSLGWQYVRITPYDVITEQTTSIRNTTLLFSALILLFGLIISRILSKRLYLPIDRIVNKMNTLEAEKRNSMFTIRQNSLRNLVLGMKSHLNTPLEQNLQELSLPFNFNEGYRLVLLRIDEYASLRADRGSYMLPYKFAIMNIASEICGQTYRVETVDMNDDSVVMLLSQIDPAEQLDTELIEVLLRQIREACRDYLKIGLSLVYSPITDSPERLNWMYSQAKEASKHRLFYGHGCIINAQAIGELQNNLYSYPVDSEKKLVEALVGGRTDEARAHFSEIVRGMNNYPFHMLQLTLSRVTVTIKGIIDNIKKRSAAPVEGLMEVPSLDDYETLPQLEEAFFELFDSIQERLADKRSSKQSDLIRQINQRINQSYMDPSLSLNQIADELNMSPIYISRLYRQQTMSAIVDVIMEVRMKEVCRLLLESDLSVSAIAEQTGFTSSSYLHRMFKRNFNVTPIEYRRSQMHG